MNEPTIDQPLAEAAFRWLLSRLDGLEKENTTLKSQLAAKTSYCEQESRLKEQHSRALAELKTRLCQHEGSEEWRAKRTAELLKQQEAAERQAIDLKLELERLSGS